MRLAFSVLLIWSLSGLAAGTGEVIRSSADLVRALQSKENAGRPFDLRVQVTSDSPTGDAGNFAVCDKTGAVFLLKKFPDNDDPDIRAGMVLCAKGVIEVGDRSGHVYPACQRISVVGRVPRTKPRPVSAAEFLNGSVDYRFISVRGRVRDVIKDDIDTRFACIYVLLDGEPIFVSKFIGKDDLSALKPGMEIEAVGYCDPFCISTRRLTGRVLRANFDGIRVLTPSTADAFLSPEIEDFPNLRPQEIAKLDRHRACGRVIAVWDKDKVLLRADDGRLVRIEVSDGILPKYGDRIEAVGFPESDMYRINLSRAIWRPYARQDTTVKSDPEFLTIRQLLTDDTGFSRYESRAHGKTVRLRGIVRTLPSSTEPSGRFSIESDGFLVQVDAQATPDALNGLSVGCEISVTGTCIMESENWRPSVPFPSIRGFIVVVRTPADIVILKRPSWWTPGRLASVLGALLVLLLGSLVWNALLKRLAERRGKELAQTAIAKVESDLKVYERTRLAVELHDSLSQYLTGISLAIRAALRQTADAPAQLRQDLSLAASSLDSCRQELRNCLWDLRNQTLDEADITTAIRQTIEPHLGDAVLTVRFNIPRERFSDKSAHAILHILRELATNAVRHGQATQVKIAGSIEGDRVLFSVRDNGRGFDPANCPGMDSGHFGLQGIRERVNQFEGTMSVTSEPGTGTKVTIALHLPGTEGNPA